MGILFCSPSPAAARSEKKKPETVINISESCVDRLTREEKESAEKQASAEVLNIPQNVSENDWIMKLKCLDDAHSNTYGLTVQGFYKLADEVESNIEDVRPNLCSAVDIIQCLKKNKCCSIKCRSHMDRFIDCVDTTRINIIKEQIECDLKEKRKKEAEDAENFLRSE
ncbi:unnamed protein product [Ceutorhynchus assimilis]|uniref:Uncharacterized protein n=1 Tax=Ceutorhynchus assimilis TaxID=467358 RepID=A0A9N9MNH9_9CUCU|nr:unnamed protein product [Ceutorhynchus assimilis]